MERVGISGIFIRVYDIFLVGIGILGSEKENNNVFGWWVKDKIGKF